MDDEDLLWSKILADENKQRVADKLKRREERVCEWPSNRGRDSAVLIPMVTTAGEPSVLFTLRSQQLTRHRNQVSFPGGIADAGDGSPMETALRETHEELGIRSCDVDVWGQLSSVPSQRKSSMVTPVLGYIKGFSLDSMKLNPAEVQQVFTLPIRHLANPNNSRYTRSKFTSFRFPVYLGGARKVWGLTAFVLDMALMHLLPRQLYTPISPDR